MRCWCDTVAACCDFVQNCFNAVEDLLVKSARIAIGIAASIIGVEVRRPPACNINSLLLSQETCASSAGLEMIIIAMIAELFAAPTQWRSRCQNVRNRKLIIQELCHDFVVDICWTATVLT